MSDDPKISQRYRELPREEPPRHLDDAILAASRRDTRSRWYFPVAAAAIIVLAVAVAVQMERNEGNLDVAEAPVAQAPAAAEQPAGKREMFTPDPKPAAPPAPSSTTELRDLYKAPSTPAAPPAAAPAPPEAENRARAMERADAEQAQARQETARAAAPPARAASDRLASAAAVQLPEQWLQGIDDLKRQGRHEEAEQQLAEFRKRYPDYRIPEALAEKFEKR